MLPKDRGAGLSGGAPRRSAPPSGGAVCMGLWGTAVSAETCRAHSRRRGEVRGELGPGRDTARAKAPRREGASEVRCGGNARRGSSLKEIKTRKQVHRSFPFPQSTSPLSHGLGIALPLSSRARSSSSSHRASLPCPNPCPFLSRGLRHKRPQSVCVWGGAVKTTQVRSPTVLEAGSPRARWQQSTATPSDPPSGILAFPSSGC